MVYSKTSFRPTRWVVAVPQDSPIKKIEDLKGKRISTEMVNFTKRYFAERNIPVEVEFSWGATEAKAAEGLVDAIVEVTETGTTIRAAGLHIIHELMESCPQLIANKTAWQDPWKREKIEQIKMLVTRRAVRREQGRHQTQCPGKRPGESHRADSQHHRADGGDALPIAQASKASSGFPSKASSTNAKCAI